MSDVTLVSEPSGALITLAGKKMQQKTPVTLNLDIGKSYEVIFSKPGYKDKKSTLLVPMRAEFSRKILLTKIPTRKRPRKKPKPKQKIEYGMLNINTVPWSYVYINGKKIQATPMINHKIRTGRYDITVGNPELNLTERALTVNIKRSTKTVCSFNFSNQAKACRFE